MLKLLLVVRDSQLKTLLENKILIPAGYEIISAPDLATAKEYLRHTSPDLLITSEILQDGNGLELAEGLFIDHPNIPIILLTNQATPILMQAAIRCGISDCLILPIRSHEVMDALERAKSRQAAFEAWSLTIVNQYRHSLHLDTGALDRLNKDSELTIALGDIDLVLNAVARTAAEVSAAESGYILLMDEAHGDLYIRAAFNLPDEIVHNLRIPLSSSGMSKVLRSGESLVTNGQTQEKLFPSYTPEAQIYTPIIVDSRVIGMLGVDRLQPGNPFSEQDTVLVSTLADFAATTIKNWFQTNQCELKRYRLETILNQLEDGLVVIGQDDRIILANKSARLTLGLQDRVIEGKLAREILRNTDLIEILEEQKGVASRIELHLEDGRVFHAQITPIIDVGLAIIMQDITHLKELDRIKTDFVNTVSHDLRSPLTAILGYAELIDRAGPITDQQKEFIRRIQFSVHNITALINDLLDLGRIEAGFDSRMEIVHLPMIIQYALEGLRHRYQEKNQTIVVDVPDNLPDVLGNPSRLRQMIANLINNSIKFTQANGKVTISARAEAGQIILQLIDNGPGIPPTDQPYIFDKFYRGSNIPTDVPGTGLGLAIVKSIVENHQGRVWLNSNIGQGTTFTIVLPIAQ